MSETSPIVARAATEPDAIDSHGTVLLGTILTPSSQSALLRTGLGRVIQVRPGDKLHGATVIAIGEGQVRVSQGGRVQAYVMPRG